MIEKLAELQLCLVPFIRWFACNGYAHWALKLVYVWKWVDREIKESSYCPLAVVSMAGGAISTKMCKEILDELDYLRCWFHSNADFGPAHTDVVMAMQAEYEKICPVPATWFYE